MVTLNAAQRRGWRTALALTALDAKDGEWTDAPFIQDFHLLSAEIQSYGVRKAVGRGFAERRKIEAERRRMFGPRYEYRITALGKRAVEAYRKCSEWTDAVHALEIKHGEVL